MVHQNKILKTSRQFCVCEEWRNTYYQESEDQAIQGIAKGNSSFESGWLLPMRLTLIRTEGQGPMAVPCLIKDLPAQLESDEASQQAGNCAKARALFISIRTAFSLENCMITNTNK